MPAEATPHPGGRGFGGGRGCPLSTWQGETSENLPVQKYPGASQAGTHDWPRWGIQQGKRTGAAPLRSLNWAQLVCWDEGATYPRPHLEGSSGD